MQSSFARLCVMQRTEKFSSMRYLCSVSADVMQIMAVDGARISAPGAVWMYPVPAAYIDDNNPCGLPGLAVGKHTSTNLLPRQYLERRRSTMYHARVIIAGIFLTISIDVIDRRRHNDDLDTIADLLCTVSNKLEKKSAVD